MHNAGVAASLQRLVPDLQVSAHPHPAFDQRPLPHGELPREAALKLLILGLMRPHEGLDIAVRALPWESVGEAALASRPA